MSLRKRSKIIKKVAKHRRKIKKESKRNNQRKTLKDPGIPNSFFMKEETAELQRKHRAKASRLHLHMFNRNLKELAVEANHNDEAFEDMLEASEENELKENAPNFKSYFKELKNVDENSDIILEVLDERDQLGSRCPEIEQLVVSSAKRMGKYKKGGIPNKKNGARRLINDWNRGVIKYYTHPPDKEQKSTYLNATIVAEFAKAFDISALEEKMELDKAPELFPSHSVLAKSLGTTSVNLSANNDKEVELEQPEKKVAVKFDKKKERKNMESEPKLIGDEQQQNKLLKKKFKQMKKNRKRVNKAASALSNILVTALTL